MKLFALRGIYLLLSIIIIVIGLATRKLPHLFPPFIAKYGGDTLWALLFFFLFRIVWINKPIWKVGIATYTFAVLIEISQLYQATWINEWRVSFMGQMILGSGFLWSDLACYAAGVLLGWVIGFFLENRKGQHQIINYTSL
jgi:hypothetical protein